MHEPRWVPRIVVEALHFDQVREHGGLPGLRDEGLLEAALARARRRWSYRHRPDIAAPAAAYGFGIVRDHPFRDGNKRAAFLTTVVFLELNGRRFDAPEATVVTTMLSVAAGDVTETQLAAWIRRSLSPRAPSDWA